MEGRKQAEVIKVEQQKVKPEKFILGNFEDRIENGKDVGNGKKRKVFTLDVILL
jgi:hypothetical protein